jgi:drug/metabolite transporter (DMT)-like permease
MSAKDGAMLFALAILWGGSFLCYRIAAPVLGPVALVEARVLLAGLALLTYALATRSALDLRARWRHYLMVGILNSAIPFLFIATAELKLTAGLAAILNATSPLFGAIVAALWIKEALTTQKAIGLLLGLLGVSVLVGWSPLPVSAALVFSIGASLAAAAFYGVGGVYTKIYLRGASPLALATCSQVGASLFVAPLIVPFPPQQAPGAEVIWAAVILALVCTAGGYLIYFRLIANIGPTRALTVTFLTPFFGVLWGILLLGETLTWSTIVAFAIILAGTGFVSGILRLRRKEKAAIEAGVQEPAGVEAPF